MDSSGNGTAVAVRTVLDRLVRSGIARGRALEHIRGGWVLVDGSRVTDPDTPRGHQQRPAPQEHSPDIDEGKVMNAGRSRTVVVGTDGSPRGERG